MSDQEGDTSEPQGPKAPGLRIKNLVIGLIVGVPAAFVALLVIGGVIGLLLPQQRAQSVDSRTRPLTGIAAWKTSGGFRVCVRPDLHECRVRFGFTNSGTSGTFAFVQTGIKAVASCDRQIEEGFAGCSDAGSLLEDSESRARMAACLLPWGLFIRDESVMHRLDDRDPQLAPGTMRMDCAEGFAEMSFADQM